VSISGLGNYFDICHGVAPVADLAAGAQTGARVHLKNYSGLCVVAYMGAVSAGTDTFVPDVQQHNAATAGTTKDLDAVTQWFVKSETTLDGDEAWARVTQAAGSEISLTGATYAATQVIVAAEINTDALDTAGGYEWVSVDMADAGAGGTRAGCIFYIPFGLKVSRRPDRLAQPNA
jgi:hypothetical protein